MTNKPPLVANCKPISCATREFDVTNDVNVLDKSAMDLVHYGRLRVLHSAVSTILQTSARAIMQLDDMMYELTQTC